MNKNTFCGYAGIAGMFFNTPEGPDKSYSLIAGVYPKHTRNTRIPARSEWDVASFPKTQRNTFGKETVASANNSGFPRIVRGEVHI